MLKEIIVTFTFTFILNMIIEYLETMPGYCCPSYCQVDHEHYKEMVEEFEYIETIKLLRDDSTSAYRLVQEYQRVGEESINFRKQKKEK